MTQASELHGWWRLVSFDYETQGTNERQRPFGANAFGSLVLSADGRMIAVMTAEGRKAGTSDADHVALFRSMIAYAGKYRIEGDKFITKVDASWNEAWSGTDQERYFKVDGNQLNIVSSWIPHPVNPESPPIRGVLSWRRET